MKKLSSFSFLCYMRCPVVSFALLLGLYVTCCVSCVPHDIETPEGPDASPPTKTFQDEISAAIGAMDACIFYDSTVPVAEIWNNINYKSYKFNEFFDRTCPASAKIVSQNELACDYSAGATIKKLKIREEGSGVSVDIENISQVADGDIVALKALWQIDGAANSFAVTKYEELMWAGLPYYKKIRTIYKNTAGGESVSAEGEISLPFSRCAYSFKTDDIRYSVCPDAPSGLLYIYGRNNAEVRFYGNYIPCNQAAYITINGFNGKYKYNGPWILRDLFDYLKPYIQ